MASPTDGCYIVKIPFSEESLDKSIPRSGIAFDLGSSMTKVCFVSKAKNEKGQHEFVFVQCANERIKQVCEWAKSQAVFESGEGKKALCTGITSMLPIYKQSICDTLSYSDMSVLDEWDWTMKGMHWLLKNLTSAQDEKLYCHSPPDEELQPELGEYCGVNDALAKFWPVMSDVKKQREACAVQFKAGAAEDKPKLPCLVAMLGSSFFIVKLNEDGTYQNVCLSHTGGKSLQGLAKMAIDTKNGEELAELAQKGDPRKMDINGGDFGRILEMTKSTNAKFNEDAENFNAFKLMRSVMVKKAVFDLGKPTIAKDGDYEKEDVAASLYRLQCQHAASMLAMSVFSTGITDIYVSGGLCSIRAARFFLYRSLLFPCPLPVKPRVRFLKFASAGALGLLVGNAASAESTYNLHKGEH